VEVNLFNAALDFIVDLEINVSKDFEKSSIDVVLSVR
jgi:hypothetical protein